MPIRALPVERPGNTVTLFPKKIANPAGGLRLVRHYPTPRKVKPSLRGRSGKGKDLGFKGIPLAPPGDYRPMPAANTRLKFGRWGARSGYLRVRVCRASRSEGKTRPLRF